MATDKSRLHTYERHLSHTHIQISRERVQKIFGQFLSDKIIIIKQENDYSDVRQLIAVARALYKIKLKTRMLIVQ